MLVFEGGEANRFNEAAIKAGVDGTLRVLAELGMWTRGPRGAARGPTLRVEHSHWERARRSGIVRIDVLPGQRVERGEVLGIIAGALGDARPPGPAGVVLGYTRHPMVHQATPSCTSPTSTPRPRARPPASPGATRAAAPGGPPGRRWGCPGSSAAPRGRSSRP